MVQHERAPTRRRSARAAFAAVFAVVLLAAMCGSDGEPGPELRRSAASAERPTIPTTSTTRAPTTSTTEAPTTTSTTTTTAPPPPTTAAPGPRVVDVIDGDTIDVEGGRRVRLIGIDTPERGECGYSEAAAALRSLVGGKAVRLVPGARDDVDRYGRLLRYVEVGGLDVNLEMIRRGHAIARYDSRDGYGRHAREQAYVAADAATPPAAGCAAPGGGGGRSAAPPSTTLAPPAGGTDPRFGTCREAIASGYGPYTRGVHPEYDWYRDADRDGVVCER